MTPIDRKRLAPSLTSDGQMSLPAEAYAGDSVLRWELEHFFDESWVCVGRSEDLRDAGDRRAVRLGRECVLLVRGERGSLRAFFNVCRHRGHELLEVGRAASGRFVRCPYHAWAYGLDGELKGAPGFGDVAGSTRLTTRWCQSGSPSGRGGSSPTPAGTPRRSRSTSVTSGR